MCRLILGILLLLLLTLKATAADLVIWPRNAVAIEGNPVTFHCVTSASDNCLWLAAESADHQLLTIYNGNDANVDTGRYLVNRTSAGQCDLTVLEPTLRGSSLMYACCADKWLKVRAYASLTILKSNLMCAHNVPRGLRHSLPVRLSFHLVYASDRGVGLSVYREGPNQSAVPICSNSDDGKKNNIRRLECDFQVGHDRGFRFFAAASETNDVDSSPVNRTVPSERFYCSVDDWLKITGDPGTPTASAEMVEPKKATAIASSATAAASESDDWLVWCGSRPLLVVFLLFTCIVIVSLLLVVFCCRKYRRKLREKRSEGAPITKEGENETFVES